jgi:bacteriocin biosynthesis cyclodehydratase domain-containing protein
MKFPRLKTFLTVFPISDTTWGLRGGSEELWRIKLSDGRAMKAFCALLPYLNGKTALEEILETLAQQGLHRAAVLAVLRQLNDCALLEEADPGGLSPAEVEAFQDQIRFFSRFTTEGGARLQSSLRRSRAGLLADGKLGASLYRQLCEAGFGEIVVLAAQPGQTPAWAGGEPDRAGVGSPCTVAALDRERVWPQGESLPQVLLVGQEAHDPQLLEAVDALSKRQNLPWMLVRSLNFQEAWIGPLFVPGETASYLSLEARLRGNLPFYTEYLAFDSHLRETGKAAAKSGALHAAFDLLASIAVIEVVKLVTGFQVPHLLGKVLTVDLWHWAMEVHEVLRVPKLDRPPASGPAVFPWKVVSHVRTAAPDSGRA